MLLLLLQYITTGVKWPVVMMMKNVRGFRRGVCLLLVLLLQRNQLMNGAKLLGVGGGRAVGK